MADIFITGGTGFVGTHMIRALQSSGHHLWVLTRHIKPDMIKNDHINWVQGDLFHPKSYKQCLNQVDYVFHLAGLIQARRQEEYFNTNVKGTDLLLQVCSDRHVSLKRFVYMSSIAAMGPSYDGKLLNESSLCKPETEYGRSKLKAEECALQYAGQIPVVIVRPTFIYGRGDLRGLKILESILSQPLVLWSAFIGSLSVCHVSDVIEGCIDCMEKQIKSGEIFILSDQMNYRVDSLLEIFKSTFKKMINSKACDSKNQLKCFSEKLEKIKLLPSNSAHCQHWACDIKKAKEQLVFQPKISLPEGAYDTIQWYLEKGLLFNKRGNSN